jgi:hypothetical protein
MRDPSSGTGQLSPSSTPECSNCSSAPKAKVEITFLEWLDDFFNRHAVLLTPSKHKTEGGQ